MVLYTKYEFSCLRPLLGMFFLERFQRQFCIYFDNVNEICPLLDGVFWLEGGFFPDYQTVHVTYFFNLDI